MTREEVCQICAVDKKKLEFYEAKGFFECRRQADGSIDYCQESLEYISLIELLQKVGLDLTAIKAYFASLGQDRKTNEAQIKILIRQRYALLDDIHSKEELLEKLDYLIENARQRQ